MYQRCLISQDDDDSDDDDDDDSDSDEAKPAAAATKKESSDDDDVSGCVVCVCPWLSLRCLPPVSPLKSSAAPSIALLPD